MEENLKYIYANVSDSVKFAEAKNGVLIGFLGAGLIGLITGFSGAENSFFSKLLFNGVVPFFGLAILVVFLSFMPVLNTIALIPSEPKIDRNPESEESKDAPKTLINPITETLKTSQPISLFYFESIKKLDPTLFLSHLYQAYQKDIPVTFPPIELDLAYQIVVNANIASAKFKAFRIAGYLTLIGIILPAILYLGN